ncbi:MAG: KOW domain-containing RNA-binding protein [Clostridium sp.]|jgi:ribosomal protein L14E/L6E/L27E|nr:KOW domain-containing RNA-binding protein [Clostridium sp.]
MGKPETAADLSQTPALERGMVVKSAAGRDKDRLLVVTQVTGEGVFLADGKERPLQRQKRKNPKHLLPTGYSLGEETLRFNNPLRKALNRLAAEETQPTEAT